MKLENSGIVYNQTWEDFSVDKELLNLTETDTFVALTSGGCNILNAALAGPRKIIAIDSNPAQNHLLRLKLAGVQALPYSEFWQLFGVGTSTEYARLYSNTLRPLLPPPSQQYWDRHIHIFSSGLYTVGALGRLTLLRRWIYQAIGEDVLHRFDSMTSLAEQVGFYASHIEPKLWNVFYAHIPTVTMVFYGVHPRQLFYCLRAGKIFLKDLYKAKQRELFSSVPMAENFFWHFILFGHYADNQHCPDYLQEKSFSLLKERIKVITIVDATLTSALEHVSESSVTKFSLSDVIEFLPNSKQEALWRAVIRAAVPGALTSYRSFAPNVLPLPGIQSNLTYYPEESVKLTRREMTASYGNVYKFAVTK